MPPSGLPPRPAVSPAVVPGAAHRTPSRPGTPARPPYNTPIAARPATAGSSAPTPVLTPLVAKPESTHASVIPVNEPAAADPLAGLDVLDVSQPSSAAVAPSQETAEPATSAPATDWLSPEGALRGEFGELVEELPQRSTAKAPVFPTPPAPWPALNTAPSDVTSAGEAEAGAVDDLDLGFEEITGSTGRSTDARTPSTDAASDAATWTPESSDRATPVEVTSIPGALDDSATEGETWADAYGAEADAIHGTVEEAGDERDAVGTTAAPSRASDWWEAERSTAGALSEAETSGDATEPAEYLAAEWPEVPGSPDPSTMPTPVIGSPTIAPAWSAGRVHDVPSDPALESARRGEEDYDWTDQQQGRDADARTSADSSGLDDWSFEGAPPADIGKSSPTTSSLSAAEALEQIAAQLRAGTLRADGYSPALGEPAALAAVLAALLGVDARWDVR